MESVFVFAVTSLPAPSSAATAAASESPVVVFSCHTELVIVSSAAPSTEDSSISASAVASVRGGDSSWSSPCSKRVDSWFSDSDSTSSGSPALSSATCSCSCSCSCSGALALPDCTSSIATSLPVSSGNRHEADKSVVARSGFETLASSSVSSGPVTVIISASEDRSKFAKSRLAVSGTFDSTCSDNIWSAVSAEPSAVCSSTGSERSKSSKLRSSSPAAFCSASSVAASSTISSDKEVL